MNSHTTSNLSYSSKINLEIFINCSTVNKVFLQKARKYNGI